MRRSILLVVVPFILAIVDDVAAEPIYRLSAFNCSRQGIHNDSGTPSESDCVVAPEKTGTAVAGEGHSVEAKQGNKFYPDITDAPNHFYARSAAALDPNGNLKIFTEVEVQNFAFDTFTAGLGAPGT